MHVQQFQTMVRSAASARRALIKRREPRVWEACLAWGAKRPYGLEEGRWRCRVRTCGYTYGVRTGTWAGLSRVPGPRKPKRGRGLAQGRGTPFRTPVFGILERHGHRQVTVVPNCSATTLRDQTLRWVKQGTLVYTDRWKGYDTLTFCGYRHLRVDHQRHFSRGKVHINGLEGFWSYSKSKFQKHHGVSPQKFPPWQFRYKHRREDLFTLFLAESLKLLPHL